MVIKNIETKTKSHINLNYLIRSHWLYQNCTYVFYLYAFCSISYPYLGMDGGGILLMLCTKLTAQLTKYHQNLLSAWLGGVPLLYTWGNWACVVNLGWSWGGDVVLWFIHGAYIWTHFNKPDQLDPKIKDQLGIALLNTILSVQLLNFVICQRDAPNCAS